VRPSTLHIIKPDNVLLSGDAAMVTDFRSGEGVVRVLELGNGGVTAPDIALGTSASMAPEQATAEPSTDARWSLDALEMEVVAQPPLVMVTAAGCR